MKNITLLFLAFLLLSTGSCKKDPLNATLVIHFSKPEPESSPADNLTTLAITAVLPPDSDPQTQVTFTTDLGTFVNSNSATITVSADASGNATASIKSALTGTATIKAAVATKYTAVKTVNFTTPAADNIFTVAAFTDNVAADGITTMVLTAAINKSLPTSAQSVVFTADNGATFSNSTPTITVSADGSGNAIAYLKKATEGAVHVTMADLGVTRNLTVTFVAPNADNVFTIAPFTDNTIADGISTMTLTAIVNKKLPVVSQVITFTADNSATFSNNTPTITVPADGTGNSTTYLKKAAEGPVHITMTGLGVSRNLTVNFVAPTADNIFTIAPFTDNIMADGTSTMALTAAVNKKLPLASQTVTFTADNNATFSNGNPTATASADAAGNATVYLKKSVEGPVHVTLASGSVTRSLTVNFTRSVPDNMLLSNNPSLSSGFGNNLTISISLQKSIGKPATGYQFVYSATDSGGNQIGVFSNGTASDANGAATVNFTTGNSAYKGIAKITIALQQNPTINQVTSVLVN